jgi:hypothetical protein
VQDDTHTARIKKLAKNAPLKRNIDYYKEEEKVTMRRRIEESNNSKNARNDSEVTDVIAQPVSVSQEEANPMAVD